jgi:hypothetical protein
LISIVLFLSKVAALQSFTSTIWQVPVSFVQFHLFSLLITPFIFMQLFSYPLSI